MDRVPLRAPCQPVVACFRKHFEADGAAPVAAGTPTPVVTAAGRLRLSLIHDPLAGQELAAGGAELPLAHQALDLLHRGRFVSRRAKTSRAVNIRARQGGRLCGRPRELLEVGHDL